MIARFEFAAVPVLFGVSREPASRTMTVLS
jgi:hypothetical protein